MAEIELIPYVPETGSYRISYPKHFKINETPESIVTITSPETFSNLTLTGYHANLNIDEKVISNFFQDFTEGYTPQSEMTKKTIGKRFFLEQRFKKEGTNWVWWAIAEENQIIIISANSEDELTSSDYNLYKFMIAEIEVYSSSFEE